MAVVSEGSGVKAAKKSATKRATPTGRRKRAARTVKTDPRPAALEIPATVKLTLPEKEDEAPNPPPARGTKMPPPRPEGLECRKCGCRHFPTDHTRRTDKAIIRYKHCRNCGTRVTTREKIIG